MGETDVTTLKNSSCKQASCNTSPLYGEVDTVVEPMPKKDGEARRYAHSRTYRGKREHGKEKKLTEFLTIVFGFQTLSKSV